MAKRRREKVSDDKTEELYTAFIDTSLDTHLATLISSSDTVSDLKMKIVLEHSQLFPRIGEIKVLSLQVKRKGHFYHLPDSMPVFSAYEGSKRHKFLFVDASNSIGEQTSHEPEAVGHVPLQQLEYYPQFNKHNLFSDDPSKHVSIVHGSHSANILNVVQASPTNFHQEISKATEMEVSHLDVDYQKDLHSDICRKLPLKVSKEYSDNNAKHIQLENLDELSPESGFAAKKRKTEHNGNGVSDPVCMMRNGSEHGISTIFGSTVTSEQLKDDQLVTSLGSKKGKKKRKRTSSVLSGQAAIPESTPVQNIEEEQNFKENLVFGGKVLNHLSDLEIVPQESIQPETFSGSAALTQRGNYCNLIDEVVEGSKGVCSQRGNAEGKTSAVDQSAQLGVNGKTSSMKLQAPNMEDKISLVTLGLDGMNKVTSQVPDGNIHLGSLDSVPLQTDVGHEEVKLKLDREVMPSERCKPLDEGDADWTNKASVHMPKLTVTRTPMENVTSDASKRNKKKRAKKKTSPVQTEFVTEETNMVGLNSSDGPNLTVKDHTSDKTDKDENMLLLVETDQTDKVEEERDLSADLDPQGFSKPADCGEAEVPTREVQSSDFLGLNEAIDVDNSTGKKKKKRKTKSSAAEVQGISEMKHVSGASLCAQDVAFSFQMSNNNNKSKSNVPCVETDQTTPILKDKGLTMEQGTKVISPAGSHNDNKVTHDEVVLLPSTEIDRSQKDRGDISESGREVLENNFSSIDNGIHGLPVEGQTKEVQDPYLNQLGRFKENDCNMDKKAKKKKKKKKNQTLAAEILLSSEIKVQNIVAEELAAPGDKKKGIDTPFAATITSQLDKGRTVIQSTTSNLEVRKNGDIESNSLNSEHPPKDANPSEVPFKGRPQAEIDNEINIETARLEGEEINFRHYFVPGEHQDKVASSVMVKEKSQSVEPRSKKEKHDVVAKNRLESSENHGNKNKSSDRNGDDNRVEESASGNEHNKVLLQRNRKNSKPFEDGVKAPGSHELEGDKTLQNGINPAVADGSEASRTLPALLDLKESNGYLTASSPNSNSRGSKRVVSNTSKRKQQSKFNNAMPNRNNSKSSAGNALNSPGREKSSFSTPRAIFREDSCESSSDENKIVNSDASTRTPSNSSSSSGYSVGQSELSQDLKRNGSVDAAGKGGGTGNTLNAKSSGPRKMSMDMLLRSSSRYKKAKLAASHSQAGDSECQPVDFVPDSQANP